MDTTQLVANRSRSVRNATANTGYVSLSRTAPTATSDPIWVVLPNHSVDVSYGPLEWPQCNGAALPKPGNRVTVVFDDQGQGGGQPVVVFWSVTNYE
jgi:hypothetical protein